MCCIKYIRLPEFTLAIVLACDSLQSGKQSIGLLAYMRHSFSGLSKSATHKIEDHLVVPLAAVERSNVNS